MAAGHLAISVSDLLHRRAVGPQPVGDDLDRAAIIFDGFLQKFQLGGLIPGLGHIAFEHLAFMVDGAPKIVGFTVDLDEHFVEVPAPLP